MATTATPTQTITTITPPSSSHGHAGGMWEYAVPLEDDERSKHMPTQPSNNVNSSTNTFSPRRHDIPQNRTSTTQSRSTENLSQTSSRVNDLRAQQNEFSNSSEPDSATDVYDSTSNNTSRSASYGLASRANKKKPAVTTSAAARSPEDDADNWIHRDKLAQIESKELEAFRVGRRASDRQETSSVNKRQRLASPVHIEAEEEDANTYDPYREDAPSVITKSFIPKPAAGRAGGSRIPLPRSVVSPSGQVEQDTSGHGTRSRNGSNGWTTSATEQSPKSRSDSHSSNNDRSTHPVSPPTSPKKTSTPSGASQSAEASSASKSKPTPKSTPTGMRKTASPAQRQPSNATKRVVSSGTKTHSDAKRPGTSSGLANGNRPTTSHRPEGEPPWMASMYKPDPRLPPDQQMLPTHAKRLAQEQWEKEGKTGTVYDRDFKLLNSEPFPVNTRLSTILDPKQSDAPSTDRIKETTLTARWPLSDSPPLGSPRSATSTRPGTSGTEHGGYKTLPSITNPHSSAPANGPAVQVHPLRTAQVDHEDEKKKTGCCACVVM